MIDFYKDLPNTKEDIEKYLRSWLQPIDNGTVHIYNGQEWKQKCGFRRAFHIHGVYVNETNNHHIFHVDEYEWKENTPPNFGEWIDFDYMIRGVSELYYKLWKLDK
jgi:hypothetical protein